MGDARQPVKLQKWKKSSVKKLQKWKKQKGSKELVTSWRDRGWIAEVVENEDGGGWAVEMRREGDLEPVYVAPWTMGRNKIDPKPLDQHAFNTWVKSASEFLMRAQNQHRSAHRRSVDVTTDAGESFRVVFDVEQDCGEAIGVLTAEDRFGEECARIELSPQFSLTRAFAHDWAQRNFSDVGASHDAEHSAW